MRGVELTPEIPVDEVVSLGAAAEDAGFDAVFASSHYNNRDPFVVLSLIAARTTDIQLGPGVANPYETHPISLASTVATLDEASGGRAIFGVGAGDRSTLRNLGVERDRPLRRVLETLTVARRLWRGERITHEGTFDATDAGLNYEVGEIPIYVGGQGPHMLRMGAKHADGILINASHPRDVEWAVEQVADGRAERPNALPPLDVGVYASVSVASAESAAREAARPPVAFIAGGADDRVLERHDIEPERAGTIGQAIEAGDFERAFELVTPGMLDAFCLAGTPAQVADRLREYPDAVDSLVVGAPLGPDRREALSLAASALDRWEG
ncbi:MAG: 5,10-methylenetetrahydromethanopterin reductase [Halodesulfurarchaeum sp.]